jgi:imidazolonepropionase-like amidohydrolase
MKYNVHKVLSLTLILVLTVLAYAQERSGSSSQQQPVSQQQFDVIIRGGTVYDGTGRAPVNADVGISGDRIAALGNLSHATAPTIVDAKGLAVVPGFINMLSHSETSWLVDSRSLSELRQGVRYSAKVRWARLTMK